MTVIVKAYIPSNKQNSERVIVKTVPIVREIAVKRIPNHTDFVALMNLSQTFDVDLPS